MYKRKNTNNVKVKMNEKVIIAIVFICFILTLTFSVISFYKSKQNQVGIIEKSLEDHGNQCKESIEEYFEYSFKILNYLANNENIYNMNWDEQYSFLKGQETLLNFEHFIIMDMLGNGYYVNRNEVKDQSHEDFFHDVIDNERFVTEPFMEVHQNRSITTLSVSIYKDKKKVGALCGVIDLNKIYNIFKNKVVGKSGYSFLINNNGDYVAHKDMQFVHDSKNIFEDFEGKSNNIDFLREGINKGETSLGKVKLNGETYYASFNSLDSVKWNAVFLIPKDEVLSGFNKFVIFQLLALTSGFLLIIFGVRIIYKNIENHRLAYTDGLTNTNNRAAVDIKFKELDNKYKSNITIVSFDLNNFKYINDNFGHSMGDKAICTLGNILFRSIPAAGMAIRYAGDEFIVLLSGVEEESVLATMKEIHNNLSRFNESGIEPFTLSVSMGYAEFGSEDDAEVFLMHMDEKMYEEKRKYHLLKKSDN